jgi:hypothetical protein
MRLMWGGGGMDGSIRQVERRAINGVFIEKVLTGVRDTKT